MTVILKRPWTRQPQGLALDSSNANVAASVAYYPVNDQGSILRAARGNNALFVDGVPPRVPSSLSGNAELAAVFDGTLYADLGSGIKWLGSGTGRASASFWIKPSSLVNAYSGLLCTYPNGGNHLILLLKSNGKLALYKRGSYDISSSYDGDGLATLSVGNAYHIVLTFAMNGSIKTYVNSVLDYDIAGNGAFDTFGELACGRDPATAGRIYSGSMTNLLLTNTEISKSGVASLYINPWQLFAPRQISIPTSAAVSGPNLIAYADQITTTTARPYVQVNW